MANGIPIGIPKLALLPPSYNTSEYSMTFLGFLVVALLVAAIVSLSRALTAITKRVAALELKSGI